MLVQSLKTSWLFLSRVLKASFAFQICICLTLARECAWKHSVIFCLISDSVRLIIVSDGIIFFVKTMGASSKPNLVQDEFDEIQC